MRFPAWRRTFVVAVASLVMAVGAFGTGGSASAAPIPEPADDPFYQPPDGFESEAPGSVLRSRSVTVTGLGIPIPVRSWQVLSRSTDTKGEPAAVVSTLMVPLIPYLGGGPRPLLSYQSAIDSLGDQCNPSYTMRTGTHAELGLMALAIVQGWAVVNTDFEGPRNAYGAGPMAGHAVLDGIRAVEQLPGTGLSGVTTPVGMWGYSGGGQATTWAAELQPSYAPELNVRGVAAGGVPADLAAASRVMDGGPFSGLAIGAVAGITREYPELLALVNDAGHAMLERIADMCVNELTVANPFRRLNEFTTVPDPLSDPLAVGVLETNELGQATPTAPIYIYHSVFDELIPFAGVQELRDTYCDSGGTVEFYADYLSEHVVLAITGAPAAVAYLGARFRGTPAPSNC
ncbi:MAG: lipase family protein [Acidimicrobiales bacterium]